ncbi:putative redox protein, regulator of disulfide bond formation [Metallosphaera yellowstonensis MK1]|jgi:uncharacterized OsmC-like protein|uniref:Putative redox protein, regulator of disulfide bond formation n=2 Tax=Metallosphaera TaxID=41980 RepID=H2C188_9CREN|nr:putative redox protein, regulator of disulfide bond formation [Metallosphaera yellowstonensis MK1]
MSMRINNIDLDAVKALSERARREGSIPMERHIQGEFRFDGSPMFVAEMRTETTKVIVTADEPKVLGGQGVHGTPLSYTLFGVMACFASTLAIEAASSGVELKELRISGHIYYDLAPVVGESDNPIIKKVVLEVKADKELGEVLRRAERKCPALYAVRNPIPVEVKQV